MTFYNDTESELSNSLNDVKEFITKPSCHTFGTTINETMQAIGY